MPPELLDRDACHTLSQYSPPIQGGEFQFLGNRGGFSGARLWRVAAGGAAYCLRAWPESGPTPQRLSEIHHLMAQARSDGLSFVPAVYPTRSGCTWVERAGR